MLITGDNVRVHLEDLGIAVDVGTRLPYFQYDEDHYVVLIQNKERPGGYQLGVMPTKTLFGKPTAWVSKIEKLVYFATHTKSKAGEVILPKGQEYIVDQVTRDVTRDYYRIVVNTHNKQPRLMINQKMAGISFQLDPEAAKKINSMSQEAFERIKKLGKSGYVRVVESKTPVRIPDIDATFRVGQRLDFFDMNDDNFILLTADKAGKKVCAVPSRDSANRKTGWYGPKFFYFSRETPTTRGTLYLRENEQLPVVIETNEMYRVVIERNDMLVALDVPKGSAYEYFQVKEPEAKKVEKTAKPVVKPATAAKPPPEKDVKPLEVGVKFTIKPIEPLNIDAIPEDWTRQPTLATAKVTEAVRKLRTNELDAIADLFTDDSTQPVAETTVNGLIEVARADTVDVAAVTTTNLLATGTVEAVSDDIADAIQQVAAVDDDLDLADVTGSGKLVNIILILLLLIIILGVVVVVMVLKFMGKHPAVDDQEEDVDVDKIVEEVAGDIQELDIASVLSADGELEPDEEESLADMCGSIDSASTLGDLIQYLNSTKEGGKLGVKNGNHQIAGHMMFIDGEIVDAECDTIRGEQAVHRLLRQHDGIYYFLRCKNDSVDKTIHQGTIGLLLDTYRIIDEEQS